jgi:hypothetical protein
VSAYRYAPSFASSCSIIACTDRSIKVVCGEMDVFKTTTVPQLDTRGTEQCPSHWSPLQFVLGGGNLFLCPYRYNREPGYLRYTSMTRYGLDDQGIGVHFQSGAEIFLFPTSFRTILWPTQFPIQWMPRTLCPGLTRPGRKSDPLSTSGGAVHLLPHTRTS